MIHLYLNYFSCDIISTSLDPNLKSDNRLNLAELKEEQFISSLSLQDVVINNFLYLSKQNLPPE